MSQIEKIYKWLAAEDGPDASRTLAAALPYAEPPYGAQIAAVLLQSRRETAWVGLVSHYTHLPAEARQQLLSRPELLRGAITAALQSRGRTDRLNALALLEDFPSPRFGYMVADLLRSEEPKIVESAARVLCRGAEEILAADSPARRKTGPPSPDEAVERRGLVDGLREAVRTYEVHRRPEVLQAALWLAKDLGEPLWEALNAPRSPSGNVVAHHLKEWNHPRLAAFLLLGLSQPAWRTSAQKLLNSWSARAELLALLQNSDLLANQGVRRNLHLINQPRWLAAAGAALADLPRYARGLLPQWICHLGFNEAERMRCLRLWLASPLPEVHRAALYALARLDTPEATQVITTVAMQSGPMNRFAKWFIAGKRAVAGTGRRATAQGVTVTRTAVPRRTSRGMSQ